MIYYFCKRWVVVDVNLQTFVPEGGWEWPKSNKFKQEGRGVQVLVILWYPRPWKTEYDYWDGLDKFSNMVVTGGQIT